MCTTQTNLPGHGHEPVTGVFDKPVAKVSQPVSSTIPPDWELTEQQRAFIDSFNEDENNNH